VRRRAFTQLLVAGVVVAAIGLPASPAVGVTPPSFVWPVTGHTASFVGHRSHPVTGEWKLHAGHDVAAPAGTPVFASASGQVTAITTGPSCGTKVVISHGDGYTSVYLHVSGVRVGVGQAVSRGQQVASVVPTSAINRGATCSTGDHLHFEIRRSGTVVDWDNRVSCGSGRVTARTPLPLALGAPAPPFHLCPLDRPSLGDWDDDGADEPAVHATGGAWRLRRSSGVSSSLLRTLPYGREAGDVGVVGDWDGDGVDDLGVFRVGGEWHLRSSSGATGTTRRVVRYGVEVGDRPVVGDWDGDGDDDLGIFRTGGGWHLRSSSAAGGVTARVVRYGVRTGDQPVVGDWDGDGLDDLGILRVGGEWHLRSSGGVIGTTVARFAYGRELYDVPVAGDWSGAGRDLPGIYRGGTWHLRSGTGPTATTARTFTFGQ
jgi:murein DD-endopeptidase MepM/ murein hydrolase activator NlpD